MKETVLARENYFTNYFTYRAVQKLGSTSKNHFEIFSRDISFSKIHDTIMIREICIPNLTSN